MTPLEGTGDIPRTTEPTESAAWREAIAFGIDVSLLEHNLTLTVEQRLLQLDEMTRLYALLSPPSPPAPRTPPA